MGERGDASFLSTLLAWWVHDRPHGRLDLPLLVHRHSAAPAAAVGLRDRGVLAPGYRADVNVIDFDHLTARRPEMVYNLPAGGKRLVQRTDGYVANIGRRDHPRGRWRVRTAAGSARPRTADRKPPQHPVDGRDRRRRALTRTWEPVPI